MRKRASALRYLSFGIPKTGLCVLSFTVFCLFIVFLPFLAIGISLSPRRENHLVSTVISRLRSLANLERRRAGALLGAPIAEPYPPLGGRTEWFTRFLRDPATWRDLAWYGVAGYGFSLTAVLLAGSLLASPVFGVVALVGQFADTDVMRGATFNGIPMDTLWGALSAIPMGCASALLGWWLLPKLARADALIARWILAPTRGAVLARRVEELSSTRAETVDARATELRRIERDLHDGAQARLVALAMSLGMAEETIRRDPEAAIALLAEARGSAGAALSELRDLVRGIHPPVLADRGLLDALRSLALRCGVPVTVNLDQIPRPPAPVEAALYFVAAEALTNITKHAEATRASLSLKTRIREANGNVLCLEITDDGRGGADQERGSGLAGMARRVAAFDGTLALSSPVGGPTVLRIELPCAS